MTEYTVEFTATVIVEAEDAVEAFEKARDQFSEEDLNVYIDGNLW